VRSEEGTIENWALDVTQLSFFLARRINVLILMLRSASINDLEIRQILDDYG